MKIVCLREQDIYTDKELKCYLETDFASLKEKLTYKNIIEKKEDNENTYETKFKFVGLLTLGNNLIIVLPKCYIREHERVNPEYIPEHEVELLMKVLKKYGKDSYKDKLSTFGMDEEDADANYLAIIDFIFQDFIEYGLYYNETEEYELNGNGGINWKKTIEKTDPLLTDNEIYYVDTYTRVEELNEHDYIRQLHKAVINDCFDKIKNFNKFLGYPNLDYHVANILEEDKTYYNLLQIDNELRVTFSERKVRLLRVMREYIEAILYKGEENFSVFGVRKFDPVWEKMCQVTLGNQYVNKKENPYGNIMIERSASEWTKEGKKGNMKPDIIIEEENDLYILDAKYYSLDKTSFPGVQDVAKQFLYEKSYGDYFSEKYLLKTELYRQRYYSLHCHHSPLDFIKRYPNKKNIYNVFLCPGKNIELYDMITMKIFKGKKIFVIKLNYKELFEAYTDGVKKTNMNTIKKKLKTIVLNYE